MPLTDTHCHLLDSRMADALHELLANAKRSGVTRFICCASSEAEWGDVLALAERESGVVPMLGLHPWYAGQAKRGWEGRLFELLQKYPAGIGECGLDFAIPEADREAQVAALEVQWGMALKLNRPLSLHCRKSFDVLFDMAENLGLPKRGAVIHAFSGSVELTKTAIKLGFHLSFSCSLMNPKNKRARSAVLAVPLDRLLLETDSPDISPNPGALNEPANLRPLYSVEAELRRETMEALEAQLWCSADKIFDAL